MKSEAEAAFHHDYHSGSAAQSGEDVFALSKSNTVEEWKQAILTTLARRDSRHCTLLALMTAARLQSRSTNHPFNDALDALLYERRVLWSDVPGHPIQISIL